MSTILSTGGRHAWFFGGGGGRVWFFWGVHASRGGVRASRGMRGFSGCIGYNEIRSMSGRYASYWNAFLLSYYFLKGTAKTNLAILSFLYCGKFVKNISVEISKQCGDPQRTHVDFDLTDNRPLILFVFARCEWALTLC